MSAPACVRPGGSTRRRHVALLVLLAGLAPLGATAQEFHVDPGAANLVRFVSRASIEEFDGTTERIDGYVLLEGPALAAGSGGRFYLEVELGTLDTGIGLRNRHMRDNYLEVERFPFATFEGDIGQVSAGPGGDFRVTARGAFLIHGVTRDRELTCRVEARGSGYRARCGFQVLLSDHDIRIPSVMFLKLANEIQLELDFTVVPARPAPGEIP